jgi:hypothetical protein
VGLDASVSCRCWQDGLTTPPPVPRELIVCTEEDGLDLSIPYDGNEDLYRDFYNWADSAPCGHEGMRQACVYVSNWTGYRLFQEALESAGWRHFPTLQAYLPHNNGGSLPARAAPEALAELQRFTSQTRLGTCTYLADEETGEWLTVPAYQGVFSLGSQEQEGRRGPGRLVRGRYQGAAAARGVPVPAMQPGGDRCHPDLEKHAVAAA